MNPAHLLRTPSPPHTFAAFADRLAYGRLSRGRDALLKVATVPLPVPWYQLGPVGVLQVERAGLEAALRTLLAGLEKVPRSASLTLPDAWVRALVVDAGPLPRHRDDAEEQLRWRLKKLLPCRPEDIRLDYLPVGENGRQLVVLALEKPLATVEEVFAGAGVKLGRVEPLVLAVTALAPGRGPGVVVTVEGRSVGIAVVSGGRLVLLREKVLPESEARAQALLCHELTRSVGHLIATEGGAVSVWLAAGEEWAEVVANWGAATSGVNVRLLDPGAGRVPPVGGTRMDHLALLGGAWEGET
jgi:hypothetical protein